MSGRHEDEYDGNFIHALELVWGEGFLSPGGEDEVAKALEGVDISGMSVLDIGSGVGGVDIALVRNHGAGSVLGIDVEKTVTEHAVARAEREGLSGRISYRVIEPGPFPLEDKSFDVVFSKDAMIHIPDKPALFAEVYRVLKPGGFFSGSDWMRGNEEPATPEMKRWLNVVGLTFELKSQEQYVEALKQAGFENVSLVDRRDWIKNVLHNDYENLAEHKNEALRAGVGDDADKYVEIWHAAWETAMVDQLAPGHLRGFKPGG
ncbi:MAG: methyltransferase domain-containing protein [Pseudomonadota bacterium]